MSISGSRSRPHPQTEADPSRGRRRWLRIAWVLFGATFLVQTAFPFTDGGTFALTAASVLLLAGTAVADAVATHGARAAATLIGIAGGGGLIAESVGVHTGFPFGQYTYNGTLGPQLMGVPVLVPLAWIMMAWLALVVASYLVGRHGRVVTAAVGAVALTAWDVFLDPQMVDQGHWSWEYPDPGLPGIADVPLTNYAGWLLVSLVMMVLLTWTFPDTPAHDVLPLVVYLWTYFSSVVAHAVFFGRPPVALVGGIIMGVIAIPLLYKLIRSRQ